MSTISYGGAVFQSGERRLSKYASLTNTSSENEEAQRWVCQG